MVYCTPSQFLTLYDARLIGQFVSDTGVPVAPPDLQTNAVLLAILQQATEELKLAVRQGERYTDAMLDSVYTDPNNLGTASQIYGIVADFAAGIIISRRMLDVSEINKLVPRYKLAMDKLEKLRIGEMLFDIDTVSEAGVAVTLVGFQGAITPGSPPVLPWSAHPRYFGAPYP